MVRKVNSNFRKVLSVIWKERPYPAHYDLIIEVLEGVMNNRQIYYAVNNAKSMGIVTVEKNEFGKMDILIKKNAEDTTEELLIEAGLL